MDDIIIDLKDYDPSLPIIHREASKAIIYQDGKFLGFKSDRGDIKLIGGGREENEDFIDTLAREIKEESGYSVIRDSIQPLCDVIERRKSKYAEAIWDLYLKLYLCKVDLNSLTAPALTDEEKASNQEACFVTLDEAISMNTQALENDPYRWVYRDLIILKQFKKILDTENK